MPSGWLEILNTAILALTLASSLYASVSLWLSRRPTAWAEVCGGTLSIHVHNPGRRAVLIRQVRFVGATFTDWEVDDHGRNQPHITGLHVREVHQELPGGHTIVVEEHFDPGQAPHPICAKVRRLRWLPRCRGHVVIVSFSP